MKILLANLPWYNNGYYGVRAGSRWPHIKNDTERDYLPFPFHLAYATALLEQHNFDVIIIDAVAREMAIKDFINLVNKHSPDYIVSEISLPSRENDLEILKKVPNNIKIILCGLDHEATSANFIADHNFIWGAIQGEYEQPLLKLFQKIKTKQNIHDIAGFIYKDNLQVKTNDLKKSLINLNTLPFPHRSSLPMKKYIDAPGGLPLPNAQMQASRGCPFTCSFCAWPQIMGLPGKYRYRDNNSVLQEMEYLTETLKFKSIYFDDDTFNVGKERINQFLDLLIQKQSQNKLLIPWGIMARADLMDKELLNKFKKAGLYSVKYGVESASQELLDNANKNMSLKKNLEMIKYTQEIGIKVHLTFIFGLLGETHSSIGRTIDLAINLNPDSLQFSIATPFPGTKFFNQLKKENMLTFIEGNNFDGNYNAIVKSKDLTPLDLIKAKERAYEKWGEHLKLSRNPQKISFNFMLLKKSRQFFKHHGLLALSFKVIDYIKFILHHNKNIEKFRFHTISNGHIHLSIKDGEIRLFHKGRELSKSSGIQTSFRFNQKRFSSALSSYEVNKIQGNEFFIQFDYSDQGLKLKQLFYIAIEENKVIIQLDWINHNKITITDFKFSYMASDKYDNWFTTSQSGIFPPINDWENMPIDQTSPFLIGIQSSDSLPIIQLKHHNLNYKSILQAQNTSRNIYARIISHCAIEPLDIPAGRTLSYMGTIETL